MCYEIAVEGVRLDCCSSNSSKSESFRYRSLGPLGTITIQRFISSFCFEVLKLEGIEGRFLVNMFNEISLDGGMSIALLHGHLLATSRKCFSSALWLTHFGKVMIPKPGSFPCFFGWMHVTFTRSFEPVYSELTVGVYLKT